jgi:hypothetical protein
VANVWAVLAALAEFVRKLFEARWEFISAAGAAYIQRLLERIRRLEVNQAIEQGEKAFLEARILDDNHLEQLDGHGLRAEAERRRDEVVRRLGAMRGADPKSGS